MIIPLLNMPKTYTARPAEYGGWVVYELEEPIAFCSQETFARAICHALNIVRAITAGKLLFIRPPTGANLN